MTGASNSELESHIIGSGALSYSWWRRWMPEYDYHGAYSEAPDDWQGTLSADDPDSEGDPDAADVIEGTVVHKVISGPVIRRAVNTIARGGVKHIARVTVAECRNLLWHPELADLDAGAADEVLQVVVFGRVIYG